MGVGNDQFGTCDSSLLTPHGVHLCLLDISSLDQSLALLLSLLQPQLDRFLCSEGAAPILIASCRAGLIAAVISQQSTALPHYLKLPTRSSLKHLPALPCRVMGKLVCVTYSLSIGRWGHQNNSFGRLPGSRMGSTWATTQLGRC